jgi:hypothetical protein
MAQKRRGSGFYHRLGGILDSAASTGGIKTSARFVLVFFIFLYLSCGLSHCANFILVSLIILDSQNALRLILFSFPFQVAYSSTYQLTFVMAYFNILLVILFVIQKVSCLC